MKKGRVSYGYTIVEVMIVLAVSAVLLVGALTLVSGQQKQAELASAATTLKADIDDVINSVATGFYKNLGDFTCTTQLIPTVAPKLTAQPPGTVELGTNQDCIFIGKAIQFGVGGEDNKYNVYSLVGLQYADGVLGNGQANSIANTHPIAIDIPAEISAKSLTNSFTIDKVVFTRPDNSTDDTMNTVAFVTDFAGNDPSSGNLNSGSRSAKLYIIKLITSTDSAAVAIPKIKASNFTSDNEVARVDICMKTGTSKFASIIIGSSGSSLSTEFKISNTVTPKCT